MDDDAHQKMERKRQREKQRRTNLSAAFDRLANVLLHVEPGSAAKGVGQAQAGHTDSGLQSTTRIDLLAETVEAIRRLHNENTKLKSALNAIGGQAAVDEALCCQVSIITKIFATSMVNCRFR
jgi:hypothetical protein